MKDWKILAKARMRELRITQADLAEKLKYTQPAVANWLNGRRTADLDIINRIFTALDLPPISVESTTDLERVYEYPIISWQSLASFSKNWKPELDYNFIKTHINAGTNGYWLRVKNDSMTANGGFTFPEGMYILVNPNAVIFDQDFVIAKNNITNQATFKKYIEEAGTKYLKPLNNSYQIIMQDSTWDVIGKVIDARWKLL